MQKFFFAIAKKIAKGLSKLMRSVILKNLFFQCILTFYNWKEFTFLLISLELGAISNLVIT